jgi:hypothetical protein
MVQGNQLRLLATVLLIAALAVGCGGDSGAKAHGAPTSAAAGGATAELDSMVVLGHSGSTGYDSDPAQPGVDVRENSWATGTNPDVDSIYQRLLLTHPALKGHSTSLGVDGAQVSSLPAQVDQMLALRPLPDLVLIQIIDNDVQCNGTDPANEKQFATTLDGVLSTINGKDPGAQIFFVDVWGSVKSYVNAVKGVRSVIEDESGTEPCDLFTYDGKVRPSGIRTLQRLGDEYFAEIERVCASHKNCWTDKGALLKMPVREDDLAEDYGHASVKGHADIAAYAWKALPDEIKTRP